MAYAALQAMGLKAEIGYYWPKMWDVLRTTPSGEAHGSVARIIFDELKRKRARAATPDYDPEYDPERRTRDFVEGLLYTSCDCAVCVVYGGDCPRMLAKEFTDPIYRRYLRGMQRARSQAGRRASKHPCYPDCDDCHDCRLASGPCSDVHGEIPQ